MVGSEFHICSLMVDHELLDNTQLDVSRSKLNLDDTDIRKLT